MSETLRFVSDDLQLMALSFMAIVYILRIRWLLKFKASRERQTPSGSLNTSSFKGIIYSWANIAMPWSMESTRRMLFFYAQFVIFHLAVAANIGMSFVIPYAAGFDETRSSLSAYFNSCCGGLLDRVLPVVPPAQQSGHALDQHAG